MPEEDRKLAAIMFTDLVGFTTLAQRDERAAMSLLEEHNLVLRSILPKHHGREVKTMGDSFLVEFSSALDATSCALELQAKMRERNMRLPDERRMEMRIGIHLGDVIPLDGDILGDAVNVSSRIEALCDPGGICITQQVYDQVSNKLGQSFARLGRPPLKNVALPVEIYKVIMPWEASERPSASGLEKKRLVVLPITNISPDEHDDYFADGLTEELIATLSKIGGIKVVARTSAMRYKGEKVRAADIGRELHVGSMVEGSVRKSGKKLRIAIQLIDTKSEEQLWAEKYDRDLEDIFSLQSEIAGRVAEALQVKLGSAETSIIEKEQTRSPEAYTLYLRGRYYWNGRAEDGVNKAMKYFEEALSRDPGYALAYVGLADCYGILGYYAYRRPALVYPKARDLAEKSLKLDDGLAEGHASLGHTLMHYYLDWPGAGRELQRAIELNPSYATARMWHATQLAVSGSISSCLEEIKRAEELDPFSMIILTDHARDLYFARDYDAAIEQYGRSLDVDPNHPIAHKGLAEVLVKKLMFDEAIKEIEKAIALSNRSIFILDDLGYIYAKSGKKPEAKEILSELDRLSMEEFVPAYGRAAIFAALGEEEQALRWAEQACEERSFVLGLKLDPAFDDIRGSARYRSMLRKVGLGE